MAEPILPIQFQPAPIKGITPTLQALSPEPTRQVPERFEAFLTDAIKSVKDLSLKADQSVLDWRVGKIENLHEVSMALARADLALRLLVQVRNKVVEAYQEVMRMQI